MKPLKRYESIELPIPANTTATRFNFPDIPQLRDDSTQDIIIQGIEVFDAVSMPNTPQGNPVSTLAQILNAFLVLYVEGEESVHWIPLVRMMFVFQNGAGGTQQSVFESLELENLKVDWTKSYIWLATSLGGASAAFSFAFGFRYKKFPPGTILAMKQMEQMALMSGIPQGAMSPAVRNMLADMR